MDITKTDVDGYHLAQRMVIREDDEYNIRHYGITREKHDTIRELEWQIYGLKTKKVTFQDIQNYKQIEKGA